MAADVDCRRWVVSGRVQGVGFRWFVIRNAELLGLAGWVRNLDDGSVEVVARGEVQVLDELEATLRQGPRGAKVSDVSSTRIQHEAVDGKSFQVIH